MYRFYSRAALSLTLIMALMASLGCIPQEVEAAPEPIESLPHFHPTFSINDRSLETLISGLPSDIQWRIRARPQYFLELVDKMLNEPVELWVLVDKQHDLPNDYVPPDLVALDDYADRLQLNRSDMLLRAILIPDLLAMSESAAQQGILLDISSAYRSYDYQAGLFERRSLAVGAENAGRDTAPAGHSQHQLGLAIDFGTISDGFGATPAGEWLARHSWRFGFSLSYPLGYEQQTGYRYESWHYRYIGRLAAELKHEFFGGLQQEMLEFLDAQSAYLLALRVVG